MIAGKKPVRNELNVASRRYVFNTAHRRELLGQPFHPLRHVWPIVVLALAQDGAIQRDAPRLFETVRETQALEGDGEENNVAILCHAAGSAPQRVEAEIVALAFGVNRVGLHSQRIREKEIRTVKIPEGVEQNTHSLVLIGSFAPGKMRAHGAALILANEHHVEVLVVVGKVGHRWLGGRCAVAGRVLPEISHRKFRLARLVFKEVFEPWGSVNTRNLGKWNLCRVRGGRRRLRGNTRWHRDHQRNSKKSRPNERAHWRILGIASIVSSRKT